MNSSGADAEFPVAVAVWGESGCQFSVRVTPGAKRNAAGGLHQGAIKVQVTQVAENGKANPQVLKVLADYLQVKKSQLELLTGATSRQKKIGCYALAPAELQERVNMAENL